MDDSYGFVKIALRDIKRMEEIPFEKMVDGIVRMPGPMRKRFANPHAHLAPPPRGGAIDFAKNHFDASQHSVDRPRTRTIENIN